MPATGSSRRLLPRVRSPHRNGLCQAVHGVSIPHELFIDRRVDEPRDDAIHTNSPSAIFVGHDPRQAVAAGFAGGIGVLPTQTRRSRSASRDDDRPISAIQHRANGVLAGQEHPVRLIAITSFQTSRSRRSTLASPSSRARSQPRQRRHPARPRHRPTSRRRPRYRAPATHPPAWPAKCPPRRRIGRRQIQGDHAGDQRDPRLRPPVRTRRPSPRRCLNRRPRSGLAYPEPHTDLSIRFRSALASQPGLHRDPADRRSGTHSAHSSSA